MSGTWPSGWPTADAAPWTSTTSPWPELAAAYLPHVDATHTGRHGGKIKSALARLCRLYSDTRCRDFEPLALSAVRQRMIDDDLTRGVVNEYVGRFGTRRTKLTPPIALRWGCFTALQPLRGACRRRCAASGR